MQNAVDLIQLFAARLIERRLTVRITDMLLHQQRECSSFQLSESLRAAKLNDFVKLLIESEIVNLFDSRLNHIVHLHDLLCFHLALLVGMLVIVEAVLIAFDIDLIESIDKVQHPFDALHLALHIEKHAFLFCNDNVRIHRLLELRQHLFVVLLNVGIEPFVVAVWQSLNGKEVDFESEMRCNAKLTAHLSPFLLIFAMLDRQKLQFAHKVGVEILEQRRHRLPRRLVPIESVEMKRAQQTVSAVLVNLQFVRFRDGQYLMQQQVAVELAVPHCRQHGNVVLAVLKLA
mmetsp:Transcript_23967/g.38029  ORF Transcript_23967/g.38029 Transcript_23967/m.38029 type:complete len:288 (+) Transcript_23967:228-1091(+)